ncbi:zinc-binding dehydrogenase [Alphaproteobacteria bacterium KMM 3653]|uniref:Zinc-binding dehydrogenase n=1 Tax=Harenicola maris TaxID=2841044 RepID=A0AAP2G9K5_9RHOB|nr:zinc-binding dehydrogenase [Harenicola maris]
MKAALHDRFGEPKDVLETRETDKPEPAKGEVRIAMTLSPIHNHDLWTVRGDYGYKPPLPGAIGGSEAVGTVEAVGEGVDEALIGSRVAIAGVHGTWAEFFLAPAAGLLPLPDQINDEMGAQLIAMPFSAISLLETLQAKPGDWIIQTAANGAVGRILDSLAKARSIHVLNLVRRDEAAAKMKQAGMENVVSTATEGWLDSARAIIGEGKALSAIDSVGGDIPNALIDLLSTDGELVVFGTATGKPMNINSGVVIFKHITIKGFWGSRISQEMTAENRTRLITELVTRVAKGELVLTTGGTFPLSDVTKAMEAALTPGRAGKILLRP